MGSMPLLGMAEAGDLCGMSPRQPVLAPRLWPETWYISWMILSRVGGGSCSPICKRGCIRQMDSCSICSASRHGCSCVSPGPWWGTSAPLAAASSKGFSGVKGLGVCVWGCGSSRAGGGWRATYEHLVLCILHHLLLRSAGHCVSEGEKMLRNSTDPSISFLFYNETKKVPLCEG